MMHERHVEIVLAHRAQQLEAVHLGHRDVADDDVEALRRARRAAASRPSPAVTTENPAAPSVRA